MEPNLIDPVTLAVGALVCWLGAAAWWLTLAAAGTLVGGGAGVALGVVLLRAFEPGVAAGWAMLVALAVIGAWLGTRVARKITAMAIGLLSSAVGGTAAHVLLRAYAPQVEPGSADYLVAVAVTVAAAGAVGTIFRRQFVMLVAALVGGLIVVTSFEPFLGAPWLGGIVVGSLVLQGATIGILRGRRRRGDDD